MNLATCSSILNDIKKSLNGIDADDKTFDQDIIMQINAAFGVLHQLGIGPKQGFFISDASTTWNEFIEDITTQNLVRQYILCSVKTVFDPPSSSFVLSALEDQKKELSFRLSVEHDRLVSEENT